MDIAVFGAGAGGLMTAITLCAHGHRCRIYERSRQSHEAGMGFILMTEGQSLMRRYGVRLATVPLKFYCCRNSAGEILMKEPMPEGAGGIRRRDLISSLLAALPAQTTLTYGAELDKLEFDPEDRVVRAQVASGAGPTSIQADLFVASDGVHSRARHALFPQWHTSPAPVMEIVGRVSCKQAIEWADGNFNKFHALDGGLAFGIVPVEADHVVWYMQFDARRFAPPREIEGPEAYRAFVRNLAGDWGHPIPSLIECTDFAQVHLWRHLTGDLVPYFHRKNLVLVGDAAHPLSPFTSQGVSSAIADAHALALALAEEPDMQRALERYSRERRDLCVPFIEKGLELTREFLAPHREAGFSVPIAR